MNFGSKFAAWVSFDTDINEFRQQVCGLGIFRYRYLAVLKISRKSGADSCSTPLVSRTRNMVPYVDQSDQMVAEPGAAYGSYCR